MGNDPDDDVADPIGGPRSGYERTAVELEQLALAIAALVAPESVALAPSSSLSPSQET
jgi:hypothetical protein